MFFQDSGFYEHGVRSDKLTPFDCENEENHSDEAVPKKEIQRRFEMEQDFIPTFYEEEQKPIDKLQDLVSFALQE
jgi:hypothetical protein